MQGVLVELSAQVCWACISVMLLRAGLLVKLRAFRARKLALLRPGVVPCLITAGTFAGVLVSCFKDNNNCHVAVKLGKV